MTASLRWCDRAITVSADRGADLEWLIEFVCPPFALGDERAPAVATVHFRRDDAAYAKIERLVGDSVGAPTPCFVLDSSVVQLPAHTDAGRYTILDAKQEAGYRVEGGAVEVVARERSGRARSAWMRVVRELFVESLLAEEPNLQLHASAVVRGGRAAVFLGPKEAGKTSFATAILSATGAEWLANDRVFLRHRAADLVAVGMPHIVSLRAKTVETFPELIATVPDGAPPYLYSLAECAAERAANVPPRSVARGRAGLSPCQYAAALGVARACEAPLAALVVVERADNGELTLEPIGVAERAVALERGFYGTHGCPYTVFRTALPYSPRRAGRLAVGHLDGVRMVRCRWSPEQLRSAGALAGLLGEMLG